MSSTPHPTTGAEEPQILDLDHLHQQTLGDGTLEADVLALFSRQAQDIVTDLTTDSADTGDALSRRSDLLHLLCGSARAVGAWEVALQAQALETEARRTPAVLPRPDAGMLALAQAVQRVCEAIERRQAATRR